MHSVKVKAENGSVRIINLGDVKLYRAKEVQDQSAEGDDVGMKIAD